VKTSNRIAFVTSVAVLSITAIIAAGTVAFVSPYAFPPAKGESGSVRMIERDFAFSGVSEVEVGGTWELDIERGGTTTLTVSAPDSVMDRIKPESAGSTLRLDRVFASGPGSGNVRARLSVPRLLQITSTGSAWASFSGFASGNMKIIASGTSRVTGRNSVIEHLVVHAAAGAHVDVGSCDIENAELSLAFSSRVTLNMAGGKLVAEAAAGSIVAYTGNVREMDFSASGAAKIKKLAGQSKNPGEGQR
jgi:hypothetical protein